MPSHRAYLPLEDAALLGQCDIHVYRSSGPGGQHRNKASSAVRLKHRPTGITVHGDDSRSQHLNKRLALSRLRMEIACRCRHELDPLRAEAPDVVRACLAPARDGQGQRRLEIGRKDRRFWNVAAFLLDLLEAFEGRLAQAAGCLGISTSNFTRVLMSQPHLLASAQSIRKRYGHKPLL